MEQTDKQENHNLLSKGKRQTTKKRHNPQFYYSFLTIVLLICLVQLTISGVLLNVTKVVSYHSKISTLESKQITAKAKNAQLKKDIKNFSTAATMESIARNNLKMAGKDEVLVIVNKQQAPEEQKSKHKNKAKK